jgi:UDP-glucose 4-epimerase
MRIILTGGAGYIGSHAAIELIKRNYDVLIIDNLSNSKIQVISKMEKIVNKKIEFIKGDMRNLKLLKKIFSDFKPDTVLHFAGMKSVEESIKETISYYENNVLSTINLLNAMNYVKCNSIIFISSATLYGLPNYLPIDENHNVNPVNPYGRTKMAIEALLQDWVNSKFENSFIILRCFNPIGADASGLIGEDPIDRPKNLMPLIAEVAVGRRAFLSIYGNDYNTRDGTAERDYVHVSDISKSCILAVEKLTKKPSNEIINIGSGSGMTVLELVKAFERVIGYEIKKEFRPKRDGDVSSSFAKIEKAKNILDWSPQYDCQEACKSFWRWKQNNL